MLQKFSETPHLYCFSPFVPWAHTTRWSSHIFRARVKMELPPIRKKLGFWGRTEVGGKKLLGESKTGLTCSGTWQPMQTWLLSASNARSTFLFCLHKTQEQINLEKQINHPTKPLHCIFLYPGKNKCIVNVSHFAWYATKKHLVTPVVNIVEEENTALFLLAVMEGSNSNSRNSGGRCRKPDSPFYFPPLQTIEVW